MKRFLLCEALVIVLLACPLVSGAAAQQVVRDELPVWRYTFKPGDNLINVAERYFARPEQWPSVQRANRIRDPHRILPGTVLRIPADMLRQEAAKAILENVNGMVRWRSGAEDWQPVPNGLRVGAGATVETGNESSVVLVLADGSRIVVSPNAQLALDSLSQYAGGLMADTRMRLQRGLVNIRANPGGREDQHFRIQTPSAQAVVRGTEFRVGVSDDATREETLGGLVRVGGVAEHTRSSVDVQPGKGTVARMGEAPIKPVALLPAPNVSDLPGRFERLPLRFPMPRLAGADTWSGQIAPDRFFERILLDKSGIGDSLAFADLPNGDYVLRLRAVDANGLRGQDALHPFTVFARPFPPGLNSPGDQATIRSATPEFVWGSIVDVPRYRVQVSTAADFSSALYDDTLTAERVQFPAALPPGPLFWRVASVLADGQQGPWNVAAFTYKPGPGAVDLGRAALQVESDTLRLRLLPPPDGLVFEAVLSSTQNLEPVLAQARSDDGVLELPRPDTGTYYLGVRLVDRSDGTPGPASVQKIDIPPSRLWLLLLLLPLGL